MGRQFNPLLLMGFLGTVVMGGSFVLGVYKAYWGNQDIWWTHQDMRLSLEDTRNAFEVSLLGEPLQRLLTEGRVLAVDQTGQQRVLHAVDVQARLNNWERVRGSILAGTTFTGLFAGMALAVLVIGWRRYLADRHGPAETDVAGVNLESDGGPG